MQKKRKKRRSLQYEKNGKTDKSARYYRQNDRVSYQKNKHERRVKHISCSFHYSSLKHLQLSLFTKFLDILLDFLSFFSYLWTVHATHQLPFAAQICAKYCITILKRLSTVCVACVNSSYILVVPVSRNGPCCFTRKR